MLSGPHAGRVHALGHGDGATLVGTGEACHFVLGDKTVSNLHARLTVVGGELHLSDLGSTNGTYVNAVRVQEATLRGGETVRVGTTDLLVLGPGETVAPVPTVRAQFGGFYGISSHTLELLDACERLSGERSPVFVEGEAGVGKRTFAMACLHAALRPDQARTTIDCGLDTPAAALVARGDGLVLAHVHAVADFSFIEPLVDPASTRFIAFTSTLPLETLVSSGFPASVARRASVFRLRPLRERAEDTLLLAQLFFTMFGGIGEPEEGWLAGLANKPWRGNAAELLRCVALKVASLEGSSAAPAPAVATREHGDMSKILKQDLPFTQARESVLEAFEARYVERALAATAGHVGHAATNAGIGRRYFQQLRSRAK